MRPSALTWAREALSVIKYRNYEIYILSSYQTQIGSDNTAFDFHVRGDKHMHGYMKYGTGWERMEIVEDSAPAHRPAAILFENTVKTSMDRISSTAVGRCVLDGFKPHQKFYVIPRPLKRNEAITEKVSEMGGGGIRVKLNPEDWRGNFDDTLLHEFVHALRLSYDRLWHKRIGHPDFEDAEEFMATQVSNVYRSSTGKTGFYDRYPEMEGAWSSLGTIYSSMIDTPLFIMALKYCLDQEAFVREIARFPVNVPQFNPFRDYAILERKALGKTQLSKFMPL